MTTFADLGVPFPLFEAPTTEAGEYVGRSTCRLCGAGGRHCFRLRVGCAVVVPCPSCGVENGLDASDRKDTGCRSCGSVIPFPESLEDGDLRTCYECLRAGKAAITKDTEFGMVSWEQAFQGVTHGVPGLETSEFERVLIDAEEDWYGVRVPQDHLFELLRTPTFNTWQDETWLFCCKRPMTYLGEWASVLKAQFRGAEPRAAFDSVFDPDDASNTWVWERLSGRRFDGICLYIFQCKTCNRFKSTWDTD
jgi:uncharacterized protein CbrC (UPF0167 family)